MADELKQKQERPNDNV